MAARRKNVLADINDIPNEDQYVFTSLLYDPKMKKNSRNPLGCKEAKNTYLLKHHFERLIRSANHLGWYAAAKSLKREVDFYNRIDYAVCNYKKETGNKGPYKVCISFRLALAIQPPEVILISIEGPHTSTLSWQLAIRRAACRLVSQADTLVSRDTRPFPQPTRGSKQVFALQGRYGCLTHQARCPYQAKDISPNDL